MLNFHHLVCYGRPLCCCTNSGLFDYKYCYNTPHVNAYQLQRYSGTWSCHGSTLQSREGSTFAMLNRRPGSVQHSIMMNVTGRRFDQSAKQLLVGHTTVHDVSDVTRCQMAVAGFYPPHLHLAPPKGGTPVEFRGEVWYRKTRVPPLSCGVVCVIICLAVLTNTDGQADGRTVRPLGQTDTRRQQCVCSPITTCV